MTNPRKIYLLAPAGGHEALAAALANGADAVYFGVGDLNMRSHATVNFQQEELPELAAKCHAAGVEFHLGFKHLDLKDDYLWRMMAVDWKALAADGTLDAINAKDCG